MSFVPLRGLWVLPHILWWTSSQSSDGILPLGSDVVMKLSSALSVLALSSWYCFLDVDLEMTVKSLLRSGNWLPFENELLINGIKYHIMQCVINLLQTLMLTRGRKYRINTPVCGWAMLIIVTHNSKCALLASCHDMFAWSKCELHFFSPAKSFVGCSCF